MKKFDFGCFDKEDKLIILNGKEYKVPGKCPTLLLLASMDYANDIKENGAEAFRNIIKKMLPHFQMYNNIDFDGLAAAVSIDEIPALLMALTDGTPPEEVKARIEATMEGEEVQKKTMEKLTSQ